jgi:hypothetical protein
VRVRAYEKRNSASALACMAGGLQNPHEKTPNARERPYYIWHKWPYMYIQYVI